MNVTIGRPNLTRPNLRSNILAYVSLCVGLAVLCSIDCKTSSAQNARSRPVKPAAMKRYAARSVKTSVQQTGKSRPKYGVQKFGAVVYRVGENFELKCDIYVPVGTDTQPVKKSQRFPAIVAIHGGAWRSGSKVTMMRHANLFAKAGYVVMAINYRHAPEFLFPAQVHDCKIAVRWLKAHADEWSVDPDRVAVFGYSAGAHLAAILGTTDEEAGLEGDVPPELAKFDSSVVCVAAGGAPCEFSWIGEDSEVLKSWLGGTRAETPEVYERASPLTYVDSNDVPFYFFHGQYDLIVPLDSSLKLHKALKAAGVPSTHEIALMTGHLSTFSKMHWAKESRQFFDKWLKPESLPKQPKLKGQVKP